MLKKTNTSFTFFLTLCILTLLVSCKQPTHPGSDTDTNERFSYLIEQSKAFDRAYDFQSALLYSDSAYQYAAKRKNTRKMAEALLRKGVVFQNSNHLDSSEATLLHAIRLCEKSSDSLHLALSLNTLGNTTKALEIIEEALQYYRRAESIYEKMGDETRQAYVLLNIGNIYYKIEDFQKAIQLYEKCKSVSIKAENLEMTKISSFNIANIYSRIKAYDKAEEAYLEVVELDKKSGDKSSLAQSYANLSCIYEDDNKQGLKLKYIKLAQKLAKESKNTKVEIQAYNLLGVYYANIGNFIEAENAYKKSISLEKEIGLINQSKAAFGNLALLKEKTGDYKQAFAYYKQYSKLSDSLINEKKLEIIYELESKYEKKKDEAEILRLSNENAIKEIRNKDLKIVLVTVFSIVFLLIGILFFIRLKTRKDRIISAQRIQQLEEEQRLLAAQSVIVGQENERKRIAQELHDGIGVLLSTASIHFSNVEESTADEKTAQMLSKANKLLKQAGGEVRKISHEMMPGVLSKFGLQEALEDIFENVEDTGSIDVDCDVHLGEDRLNENTEIILFRIVQEILNNTLKHAHAKHIYFSLKQLDDTLLIKYKDDGEGFDPSEIVSEKSLGLSGIKSRVDFLRGKMKLVSSPGKGTEYDIRIQIE
jgi:signal transduction histidine kinase